jgi:LytS/YehU family sensor histidine kinase
MPLELDLQMARLEAKLLRAQFSSHFVFNHLNAINYFILRDEPKRASSYLTLFARLLRRFTADSRHEFVRLSDEIETIRLYVQVESLRFGQPIEFVVSLDPGIDPRQVWVPSLILHTYVENAVWSTLQQPDEAGTIAIKLIKKSGRFHLLLKDNGQKQVRRLTDRLKPEENTAMDLTRERLQLLNRQFGTDLRVTMDDPESSAEQQGPRKRRSSRQGQTVDLSFHPFAL